MSGCVFWDHSMTFTKKPSGTEHRIQPCKLITQVLIGSISVNSARRQSETVCKRKHCQDNKCKTLHCYQHVSGTRSAEGWCSTQNRVQEISKKKRKTVNIECSWQDSSWMLQNRGRSVPTRCLSRYLAVKKLPPISMKMNSLQLIKTIKLAQLDNRL